MIAATINIVINLLLLILPFIFISGAGFAWLAYRRLKWQRTNYRPVLLRIKVPPLVDKTPAAMHQILNAMYDKSYGTYLDRFIDGRVPLHISLEIVSISGEVRFYAQVPEKLESLFKSQFYGQYTGVEFERVEDYLRPVDHYIDDYKLLGLQFGLKSEEIFPIQTYTSNQLEKIEDEKKDARKIDPFNSFIEYMGSIGYGEELWLQIMIRGDHKQTWKQGQALPFAEKPSLNNKLEEFINKLKEGSKVEGKIVGPDGKVVDTTVNKVYDPGVDLLMLGLGDRKNQTNYDVIIRGAYVAEDNKFNSFNIAGLIKSLQGFSSAGSNAIVPSEKTDFSSDWQEDFARLNKPFAKIVKKWQRVREKEFISAYKRRSGFYQPHRNILGSDSFKMTAGDIATIFHLPINGGSPVLKRIEAIKSEPPSNLPI
jgi:hypothetical protein